MYIGMYTYTCTWTFIYIMCIYVYIKGRDRAGRRGLPRLLRFAPGFPSGRRGSEDAIALIDAALLASLLPPRGTECRNCVGVSLE